MFLIYCSYLTALSHTYNIAGVGCEDKRSTIALMILIKDENRRINFYRLDYTISFLLFFKSNSALIPETTFATICFKATSEINTETLSR